MNFQWRKESLVGSILHGFFSGLVLSAFKSTKCFFVLFFMNAVLTLLQIVGDDLSFYDETVFNYINPCFSLVLGRFVSAHHVFY